MNNLTPEVAEIIRHCELMEIKSEHPTTLNVIRRVS